MKKYIKVCPECGNTFETDDKEQKCCKPCIAKICNQYLPTITNLVEKPYNSFDEACSKHKEELNKQQTNKF